MKIFWFELLLAAVLCCSALAFAPEAKLEDKEQEVRAIKIFHKVRCMICNGQTIESSDSQFAYNLRNFIREKIAQKITDEQIEKELVVKFGDDILLTPPRLTSYFLCFTAILLSFVFLIYVAIRPK